VGLSCELMPISAFRKVLDVAEDIGDLSFQMKALWGLFVERSMVGDYAVGATIARRFAAIAERLSLSISVCDPLLGLALHHCGQHAEARLHVERVIRIAPLAPQVPRSSGYGYDDRRTRILAYLLDCRCPSWVKTRKPHSEHKFSRMPSSVQARSDDRSWPEWARQLGPGSDLHDQPDPAGRLGLSARQRAGCSRASCSCNRTAESAVVM
jgi:hypothetical protein